MGQREDISTGSDVAIESERVKSELDRLKNRLYNKLDMLEQIEKQSYSLIPKEINHRNAFIFQERLRLISEISKLSLQVMQEISKLSMHRYKIVMDSKSRDKDGELSYNAIKDQVQKIIDLVEERYGS